MSSFEQRKELFNRVAGGTWIRDPDWAAVQAECTEDFVLDYSNSIGPLKGIYRGTDELRTFRDSFRSAFSDFSLDLDELIDTGPDSLVAATNVKVVGEGSGAPVSGRGGLLVEFRGDRVARIKLFQSKDEALAAVKGTP